MPIQFIKRPGQKILELGGGSNRSEFADCNVDIRGGPGVDFVCDFEQPLPIQSEEWDSVYCAYCLEHLPFISTMNFLREVLRVLKPSGKAIFLTPNLEAQMKWILDHPEGWDGKDLFIAASELIFGTQDYPSNLHRSCITPATSEKLFRDAGFVNVGIHVYGERNTDLAIDAQKPATEEYMREHNIPYIAQNKGEMKETPAEWKQVEMQAKPFTALVAASTELLQGPSVFEAASPVLEKGLQETEASLKEQNEMYEAVLKGAEQRVELAEKKLEKVPAVPREELFDKAYFNGGGKVGGYAKEGYWDYPCHWATFQHILDRKPTSVLEVGAARGYIVKRLQDYGVDSHGLEISRHCYLTRVTDPVHLHDLCKAPWPIYRSDAVSKEDNLGPRPFDLNFSIATMEHVPEEFLPAVIKEMERTCKRGFHAIDFGEKDDGWDKTHCTLRSKEWWTSKFKEIAPNWPVEIVDKEDIERGSWPNGVREGDGKLKVAIGTYSVMSYFGWTNLDIHDLSQFAQQHGYKFLRCDVRQGLPFQTGSVDLLHMSHFLEHLSNQEAVSFLRECRRAIKPSGAMRIVVPDTETLVDLYQRDRRKSDGTFIGNHHGLIEIERLKVFDEINQGCSDRKTSAGKLWELLFSGHQACYDRETLCSILHETGFNPLPTLFRRTELGDQGKQILRETTELFADLSCFCEAVPKVG